MLAGTGLNCLERASRLYVLAARTTDRLALEHLWL